MQKLVRRYEADGDAAFEPRSRRPRHNPRRVATDAVEDAIGALRKELTEAGHDAGAETIRWHLTERGLPAPSVATIWRGLSRRRFVAPQRYKRPRSAWRRFEAGLPNAVRHADITHWPRADGAEVEILNVVDDPRNAHSVVGGVSCLSSVRGGIGRSAGVAPPGGDRSRARAVAAHGRQLGST